MVVYRTTRCPHCGYLIENMTIKPKEDIGPPTALCPGCGSPYRTGMQYWRDMSGSERVFYTAKSVALCFFAVVVIAPILALLLLGLVDWVFGIETSFCALLFLWPVVAAGIVWLWIVGMRTEMAMTPDGPKESGSTPTA